MSLDLNNLSYGELLAILKEIIKRKEKLRDNDIENLHNYECEDYAIQGAIGLLTFSKARLLLGRKQPFDVEIKEMCESIEVSFEEIEKKTGLSLPTSFDELWSKVYEVDYQDAPNNWVPKDDTWRIHGKE